MEFWGWLILLSLCVLLFFANCTGNTLPSASPTQSPSVTIIQQSPDPKTVKTPPFLPTITTPTSPIDLSDAALHTPPPTCYETPAGGILCMGYVENRYQDAVTNIMLDVGIYNADGAFFAADQTVISQRYIYPGGRAPYHILFAMQGDSPLYPADRFGGVQVRQAQAERIKNAPPPLPLEDRQAYWDGGRYVITGMLNIAGALQVVITLYDADERVVGYRILEADHLERLQVEIIPQAVPQRFTVDVYPLDD